MPPPCSEDAVLSCLAQHFPLAHASLLLGRGDDAALLKAGRPLCVSSDLFLEDVHFRRSYFTPEEAGHKALAVNISDMAACGAQPFAFTLCLGLPPQTDMVWVDAFSRSMAELADKHGMALAGGDIAACERVHIAITIWGGISPNGVFLGRGGSVPGDCLFVIGTLGLARVGLRMLEAYGRNALRDWPCACAAHLLPTPQTAAGIMLARAAANARPPALMDVSDGIARDLPRLLHANGAQYSQAAQQRPGAVIRLQERLLHPEVRRCAEDNKQDPVREALIGGEDYALLGSCAPDMLAALKTAVPGFTHIGEVTEESGILCNGEPLERLHGFDHFDSCNAPTE
ncbi:MAG: thiamine-phosphate kinase [Desulfovibrio sp.]|jgi:thiamine-monophosphate kinase|nr:thiamine-phosphate kinase [Desulfovibrio sp.]